MINPVATVPTASVAFPNASVSIPLAWVFPLVIFSLEETKFSKDGITESAAPFKFLNPDADLLISVFAASIVLESIPALAAILSIAAAASLLLALTPSRIKQSVASLAALFNTTCS